jgi:hypothetical protein
LATKYYLVPFDAENKDNTSPKYVPMMLSGGGRDKVQAVIALRIGGAKEYREDFFVLRVMVANLSSLATLEQQGDVIDITPGGAILTNKSELVALGVDASLSNTEEGVETKLFEWLLGESKTLASAFAGRPEQKF